jgi:carbonic anhydrase
MCTDRRFSRRNFIKVASFSAVSAALAACNWTTSTGVVQPTLVPEPPVTNAEDALKRLVEGNKRYATVKSEDYNESKSRRAEVAKGQHPFAIILGCVDSRVPPELVFDRGLGDLFVIRTAGQVLDKAVLGSLEFGVAELKIPLMMVLGHEKCGAVSATIEAVEKNAAPEAEIGFLVNSLRPALEKAKGMSGDKVDNVVKANVEIIVSQLKNTPILAEAVKHGALKIVGARYDLDTGLVGITVP